MRETWTGAMEVLIARWMRATGKLSYDAWEVQIDCARYWHDRGRTHMPEHWMRAFRRVMHFLPLDRREMTGRLNADGRRVRWSVYHLQRRVMADDVTRLHGINWR